MDALESAERMRGGLPRHSHCPDGCEKAQPFRAPDGRELCGRCFFRFGEEVEMVPCTPETCPGDEGGGS